MVVIWEPYRGFYLFLELLSLKEYCGNPVTNLKSCIRQYTHFPDTTNNYLKPSLNKLEDHNLISWKGNISDFDVNVFGTVDDLISEYGEISVNRNKIKFRNMYCKIHKNLVLNLDEIYFGNNRVDIVEALLNNNKYPVPSYMDIAHAFFHEDKYNIKYFPIGDGLVSDRTIVIQLVKDNVEEQRVNAGVAKDFARYFA